MSINREPKLGHGFIYILKNDALKDETFKIGLTTNSIQTRIKELHTTGVPKRFQVVRLFEIEERFLSQVEKMVHQELKLKGFHYGKEFFRCSIADCEKSIEDVIFKLTKNRSEELVGEAEIRSKFNEKLRQWQIDESKRKNALLEDLNSEIKRRQESWTLSRMIEKGVPAKPDLEFPSVIIGLASGLGGILILGLIFLALMEYINLFVLSLATGFVYIFTRNNISNKHARQLDEIRINARKLYPLKEIDDIPAERCSIDYESFKKSELSTRKSEESKTIQAKRSHPLTHSDKELNKDKPTPKSQDDLRRNVDLKSWYFTKSSIIHKESQVEISLGKILINEYQEVFRIKGAPIEVMGKLVQEISFREVEKLYLMANRITGAQILISCPKCGQKINSSFEGIRKCKCPSCGAEWGYSTDFYKD